MYRDHMSGNAPAAGQVREWTGLGMRRDVGRIHRLADGRALGFAEFGPRTGIPLFFFSGGGSTRLTRHPDDSILEELGVRLITIDRPGIGLSDYHPKRRLLDWPEDIAHLADSLGIDRFAVLGWSAGGPHALVCAYKIPHRLHAVGVMSGIAPLHWPGLIPMVTSVSSRLSSLIRGLARLGMGPGVPSPVRGSAESPEEVRAIHRQRLRDIVRAGEWERAVELLMLASPWGFRLQDITTPVHLWWGTRDATTPLHMAAYLQRTLPSARLRIWPDEGHHVGFTHWREVVETLVQ